MKQFNLILQNLYISHLVKRFIGIRAKYNNFNLNTNLKNIILDKLMIFCHLSEVILTNTTILIILIRLELYNKKFKCMEVPY